MANCTEEGNLRSTLNQASPLPTGIAVFLFALNICLSITASLGNALILIALHKVSSVHPTTKLLFRNLAVTDLCVGLFLQPLFATRMLNAVTKINVDVLCYIIQVNYAVGIILCGVSAFTSTAISVDRLLALMLSLRYRHVVTLRRVRAVIICFWLVGVSVVLIYVTFSRRIAFTVVSVVFTPTGVISLFSYTKIFLRLRQHQAQVQNHVHQRQANGGGIPLNIARYKKTVSSIAWVQLALVLCYLPFVFSIIIIRINGWSGMRADIFWISTTILVYLNSSLNPFLYYWKIRDVRQAVKNTVKQFPCL